MREAAEDEEDGDAAADDVDAARPAGFRPGPLLPAPPDCIQSPKIHHLHYHTIEVTPTEKRQQTPNKTKTPRKTH